MRSPAFAALLLSLILASPSGAVELDRMVGGLVGDLIVGPSRGGQRVTGDARRYGYHDQRDYERERRLARRAQERALDGRFGQRHAWRNPDTGNEGVIQVVDEGLDRRGRFCRLLAQTVAINGRVERNRGMACQPARGGSWRIER